MPSSGGLNRPSIQSFEGSKGGLAMQPPMVPLYLCTFQRNIKQNHLEGTGSHIEYNDLAAENMLIVIMATLQRRSTGNDNANPDTDARSPKPYTTYTLHPNFTRT